MNVFDDTMWIKVFIKFSKKRYKTFSVVIDNCQGRVLIFMQGLIYPFVKTHSILKDTLH